MTGTLVEYIGLLELVIFVIVLFGFIIATLCRRVPVKLTVQSKASQNIGALLFLLLVAAIVLSTLGSAELAKTIKFNPSLPVKIAGDVIMLPSILLMGWSQYSLGRQWTAVIQIVEHHELIVSGPYAYIRHPFTLSILGFNIGALLFAGSWIPFVMYFLNFLWSVYLIPLEERALFEEFGVSYLEYRQNVGAFFPNLSQCWKNSDDLPKHVEESNSASGESFPIRKISQTIEKYGTMSI